MRVKFLHLNTHEVEMQNFLFAVKIVRKFFVLIKGKHLLLSSHLQ